MTRTCSKPLPRRRGRRSPPCLLSPCLLSPLLGGLVLISGLTAGPAHAQDAVAPGKELAPGCPSGAISNIIVQNHSIFPASSIEERRFTWAYSLINTLNIRTREEFIRRELLLEEGDCFDSLLLAESERLLRDLRFISGATVTSTRLGDGSHEVTVETQDEWTTRVNVGVAMNDGFRVEGIDLLEENFLGRGMLIGMYHRDRDERQDLGLVFETPYLFDTRWNAGLALGRSRVGWLVDQRFIFPFVGEVGRLAARQRFSRREGYFTYATGSEEEDSHVLVPFYDESLEFAGAVRFGEPGNLFMLGFGFSRDALGFFDFPLGTEVVREGDFSESTPAGLDFSEPIRSQITPRATSRLNLLLGQRWIRYESRRGLDAQGVQDIRLGTEVALTLGRSVSIFQQGPAPNDFFSRVDIFWGAAPGNWVIQGKVNAEGRRVFVSSGRAWRDVFAELDTYIYFQPEALQSHTFFGRISSSAGWGVEAPFQLTLGGRDGLTGYSEEAFPVGRRTIISVEDRIAFNWPAPDFIDLGMSIFGGVGMGAAGDVPFGRDSGVKASAGAGLRIGFPAGSKSVVRLDFAVPIEGGAGLGDAIFRLSIGEIAGIARGFGDPRMARSIRAGVTSDFTGLAR